MPKRYHINEKQVAELEAARNQNKDKNVEKRLKALLLHAQGEKRESIAEKTEFAKSYVSELVSKYCNNGLSAIADNNYQVNRCNMSFAEEEAFLASYMEQAENGQIASINDIERDYEEKVGHNISSGQIYKVLARHGWRKVMPRSTHPNKASDEDIEASKKLT